MKLTTHYRDSLDQPLCTGCAQHSILKTTVQMGKDEPCAGYDPMECAVCNNLILLEDEETAKAVREQQAEADRLWDAISRGKVPYRWQDDPFFI